MKVGEFSGNAVIWIHQRIPWCSLTLSATESSFFLLGFVLFYLVFEEEGFWCLLGLGFGFEISSSSSSCSLWKGPSKDRFYRGGKGGDSAIQPTLLRPQFWMSLLALLSNLPLFFLFYYVLAMGFFFFLFLWVWLICPLLLESLNFIRWDLGSYSADFNWTSPILLSSLVSTKINVITTVDFSLLTVSCFFLSIFFSTNLELFLNQKKNYKDKWSVWNPFI